MSSEAKQLRPEDIPVSDTSTGVMIGGTNFSETLDEISTLKEKVYFLEVMLMRVLDALELSHTITFEDK